MSEKTIFEPSCPVAQRREAVVELLSNLGRSAEPLSEVVDLGAVRLVHGAGVLEPAESTSPTGEWPGGYIGPVEEVLQEVA